MKYYSNKYLENQKKHITVVNKYYEQRIITIIKQKIAVVTEQQEVHDEDIFKRLN